MTEKLKPCPFCGGKAVVKRVQYKHGGSSSVILDGWEVHCVNNCCHTKTHESKIYQEDDGRVVIESNGAEKAIKAWNTRADERPKGEWIIREDFIRKTVNYKCSDCGSQFEVEEKLKLDFCFCPHCGADMRKENTNANT